MNSNIEIPFEYTQEGDKCQMCYDPNIIEINSCQYCHPSEVETTRNDFCYPSEVETTRNEYLSLIMRFRIFFVRVKIYRYYFIFLI